MSIKSIVAKTFFGVAMIAVLVCVALYMVKNDNADDVNVGTDENGVAVYKKESLALDAKIEIDCDTPFVLTKTDGVWEMATMEGIEVKAAYADALLKSLSEITSPMIACENCTDAAKYGLDEPIATIKLTLDDETVEMVVGSESGEYYYFALQNDDNVYIVSKENLSMVFKDKMKYLDTYVVNTDTNKILSVQYGDVQIEKQGDYWFETKPYNRLADDETVKTKILTAVSSINAENIVKKSEVGKKNGETVKIVTEDETIKFSVVKKDAQYSYVAKNDSKYAYVVKNSTVDFLNVTGFEIVTKYIAPIYISEVEKIELIMPMGKHVIDIEAPDSEAAVFYLDGEEAQDASVRDFYASLVSLTFKGEGSSTEKAEYEVIFTHTDGEKTDVKFLPYSQTDYAVSINGKTQFTVTRKSVSDVFGKLRSVKTVY